MISADIFRGRYRESLETPKPIVPDKPFVNHFTLPTANHLYLPGHRMMVQIQSTWFTLYEPQFANFCTQYLLGQAAGLPQSSQDVYHRPREANFIELPLVLFSTS
jgi:predicted acyl esterase